MKTWYFAICDEHKEACDVMVSNPRCTGDLLGEKSTDVQAWLTLHGGCALRLGWDDHHLDFLWQNGYTKIRLKDDVEFSATVPRETIIRDLIEAPVMLTFEMPPEHPHKTPGAILERAQAIPAQFSDDGDIEIQVEVGCINGLAAWCTIARVYEPDYQTMMMTEGNIPTAEEVAAAILGCLRQVGEESIARIVDPETWEDWDRVRALDLPYPYSGQKALDLSLEKARAILALVK